jgi:hypothetical protein
MSGYRIFACFCSVLGLTAAVSAQPILSVDFSDRSFDPTTNTQANFQSFVIGSQDGNGILSIQTNTSTRVFGAISVTISGNGSNPGYDDRQRSGPPDSGDFTQSLLLRDFVFSPSTTNGSGLNVLVQGLNANRVFQVTIWSFDDGSSGVTPRVSDWYANGTLVRDNYAFNGGSANRPTNNLQYQFSFKVTSDELGRVRIEGRRDSATGSNPGVFLNAFQIESAPADLPQPVIYPAVTEVYFGDNSVFSAQVGGTPPFSFRWLKNGNAMAGATNSRLTIFDTRITDIANYSVIVSNAAGVVTSAVATISTVLPVLNLSSGLISHWPFDTASSSTPDIAGNNHLFLTNMFSTNLIVGRVENALAFDGTTQFVSRVTSDSTGLPIYKYPAYTAAFWVRGDFTGQDDRRVFAEASTTNNNPIFSIGTHHEALTGSVDIFIRNNNGTTPVNHLHSTRIAFDNSWHHVAWVDNNGYARLYVDGLLDSTDFTYVRGSLTLNTLSVGALLRANPDTWFAGAVDQVAVWRRSLTASEVQQVFASGPPRPLEILGIQVSFGNIILTFHAPEPSATYRVEQVADVASQWSVVQNVSFSANGNTITAQFPAPATSQRFYRIAR